VGPLNHGEVCDHLDPAAPSCGLQVTFVGDAAM